MARATRRAVTLPSTAGKKKLSFALTPLADAMFQLLIFFMLSSSLAPYSLISLTPGAASAEVAGAEPTDRPIPGAGPTIWHLSADSVRSGAEVFALSDLPELLSLMAARGSAQVVIFTDASATVQDIATVLNQLTLAELTSVQLISAEGR